MLKKLAFALALLLPSAAAAQSFPKPPDVPAYQERPITYAAGTDENCLGNQVLSGGVCTGPADGGPMPVESYPLTLIDTSQITSGISAADFIETTAAVDDTDPANQTNYGGVTVNSPTTGHPGTELKYRFGASACKVSFDDPVRDYSEPGQAHAHIFWGNCNSGPFTSYASARMAGLNSSNSGAANNSSSYWSTAPVIVNAFGDGRDYVPSPDSLAIYYKGDKADLGKIRPLPQGFRGVFGWDMDVGDQRMIDAVAAANAQPGTAGRYQYFNTGNDNPWGYDAAMSCVRADGSQQTGRVFADMTECAPGLPDSSRAFVITVVSPKCIDGYNLWSPGGYKHWIPAVRDTVKSKFVCPQGYWESFEVESKLLYNGHEGSGSGPRNVNNWKFSCQGQGALPPTGRSCFHQDLLLAWDKATYDIVMLQAFDALAVGGNGVRGHEMNDARISATQKLKQGSGTPSRRQPILDIGIRPTSDPAQMTLLPPKANSNHHSHVVNTSTTIRLTRDNNKVIVEGDSLAGEVGNRYGALRTQFVVDYTGFGTISGGNADPSNPGAVGGSNINDLLNRKAAVIAAAPKVVTVKIGSNNDYQKDGTSAAFITALQGYATDLRAAGIKVLMVTSTPRDTCTGTCETSRLAMDTAIRASVGTWSDGYVDYARSTIADEQSDASNATYYSDGTHLTSAGWDVLFPFYRDALDMILRQSL